MKKMAEFSMTKTRSKIEKLKPIYAIFFAFVAIFLKPYVAMPELTLSPQSGTMNSPAGNTFCAPPPPPIQVLYGV
jgi:hypothetical protein